MTLTIPQMTLLKTCVHDEMQRMEKTAGLCIREESIAAWKAEAAAARELLAILDDALYITVESAHLTPQPNPAHKEALEKMHEALTEAPPTTKPYPAHLHQMTERATQLLSEDWDSHSQEMRALWEEPSATTSPAEGKDAPAAGQQGPHVQPTEGNLEDTSPDARRERATHRSSPSPATHCSPASIAERTACTVGQESHDAASSLNAPTSTHVACGLLEDSPSACGEAMNSSGKPSASAAAAKPALGDDCCGDIHCSGRCRPR